MSKYYVTSGDLKDIVDTKLAVITDAPLDAAAFALNRSHARLKKTKQEIEIDGKFYVDERGHLTGNAAYIFPLKKVCRRAGWKMDDEENCKGV